MGEEAIFRIHSNMRYKTLVGGTDQTNLNAVILNTDGQFTEEKKFKIWNKKYA